MNDSPLYLLDTNVAAYIVSGRSRLAREKLHEALEHASVALSTISQAEILLGFENKPQAARLRIAVEKFFSTVQILAWDATAAHAYSKLRKRLATAGKNLSTMDMLIAAHAAATGAILVTRDKAFLHAALFVDVADWAADL